MRFISTKFLASATILICSNVAFSQFYTIDGRAPQNISSTNNNVKPGWHYSGWQNGWQPGPGAHEIYYNRQSGMGYGGAYGGSHYNPQPYMDSGYSSVPVYSAPVYVISPSGSSYYSGGHYVHGRGFVRRVR